MSDWKVVIETNTFGYYVDLFIYRKHNGKIEVMTDDSKGNKIIVEVEGYATTERLKPTLRLNTGDAGQIMKALADALDNHGVKTDSDAKMSGILEATKVHLEDMRKLVFK